MGWIERVRVPRKVQVPEIDDVGAGQAVPVDPRTITLSERECRQEHKDGHE
jgi:hypothetical protein